MHARATAKKSVVLILLIAFVRPISTFAGGSIGRCSYKKSRNKNKKDKKDKSGEKKKWNKRIKRDEMGEIKGKMLDRKRERERERERKQAPTVSGNLFHLFFPLPFCPSFHLFNSFLFLSFFLSFFHSLIILSPAKNCRDGPLLASPRSRGGSIMGSSGTEEKAGINSPPGNMGPSGSLRKEKSKQTSGKKKNEEEEEKAKEE